MGELTHLASKANSGSVAGRKTEQGVILFVTLIMLVILTISGVAMMQIMEAGVSAAGNIAFRQASLRVADVAMEDARTWLLAQDQSTLQDPAAGRTDYYANLATSFNPLTDSWSKCVDQDGDGTCDTFSGYKLYYVIHRMARANGACSASTTFCLFPSNASSAGTTEGQSQSGGSGANQGNIAGTTGLVFYRITVKVSGPRHNINYVQALMY